MKKRLKYFLWIPLIAAVLLAVNEIINHYDLSKLTETDQKKIEEVYVAFKRGEIVPGTVVVFKDGEIGIFISGGNLAGAEILTYAGRHHYFLFSDFVMGVKNFYPPDDSNWGFRDALLDDFSRNKLYHME